jgi:ubiquinone/menaquinone biosynthesis C-methylase UbiE
MPVNYDKIAARFEERYQHQSFPEIRTRLCRLANRPGARVLEVGCGTGHWLSILGDLPIELLGVDPSFMMLRAACASDLRALLVCASAESLPFASHCIDLLFCVNAFHHFSNPERFLRDSRVLLRTGGRLAIFGLDPHGPNTEWYLYDYFPGVREMDLLRYPDHEQLKRLITEAGFRNVCHGTR